MLISADVDVIRSFSDPLRAKIISILSAGPACTCHLVEDTGAKQPTVSHHLRLLRQTGIIEAEPSGRYTYYRLNPEAVEEAAQHLTGLAEQARRTAENRREC